MLIDWIEKNNYSKTQAVEAICRILHFGDKCDKEEVFFDYVINKYHFSFNDFSDFFSSQSQFNQSQLRFLLKIDIDIHTPADWPLIIKNLKTHPDKKANHMGAELSRKLLEKQFSQNNPPRPSTKM